MQLWIASAFTRQSTFFRATNPYTGPSKLVNNATLGCAHCARPNESRTFTRGRNR